MGEGRERRERGGGGGGGCPGEANNKEEIGEGRGKECRAPERVGGEGGTEKE